jgi:hypothetical protein
MPAVIDKGSKELARDPEVKDSPKAPRPGDSLRPVAG